MNLMNDENQPGVWNATFLVRVLEVVFWIIVVCPSFIKVLINHRFYIQYSMASAITLTKKLTWDNFAPRAPRPAPRTPYLVPSP